MERWLKKHKVWFSLLCIALAIYIIFAATRYSAYTTFVPFTGRVLNIGAEDLDVVFLHSGESGKKLSYSTDEQVQKMADSLNSFRYVFWLPKNPIPSGGWTYRVGLEFKDGTKMSYYFGRDWIEVRGVRYFSHGSHFHQWAETLDNLGR